ncbi:HAMP domain-containing sensor histidine kinase [Pedobacter sp. CG_S7]|uniref:sensor histidine kinase n=1 Tax=Pedobacter sp. CG_S7 TaxID=3143930 RepID=UPI0033919641
MLIGDPKEFSLQSRIFHTVTLLAIIIIFGESIFYMFTSLHEAVLISTLVGLGLTGLYYLSRYKKKLNLAITLTIIALSITHIFAYMYNAGIAGNAMLLSVETLFFVLLIVPSKVRFFWFMVTLAVLLVMVYLEYINPGIVKKAYLNRTEQYLDLVVSYFTVVIVMYIGLVMIRNNYELQKNIAEEKAAKLEKSNQEKDKLFSIISSELSAPIASVKHYLDLLQADGLNWKERTVIEQDLTRSLGDAKILLNNLLLWSKSRMELNYLQLGVVNLKDLLQETIEIFQQRADKKGISIDLKIEEEINISADPNMLKVVMRNLLNNAIKFSHLKGVVGLSVHKEGSKCIISIKDNGVGMTADKQQRIFTLNVTSSYGTANEKGTGLGLILCRDFILQQGGEIWFNSIAWEGTTFYVSLPMAM